MSVRLFALKVIDSDVDAHQVDWRFVFALNKNDAASKVSHEKPGLLAVAVYEPLVLGEEQVQYPPEEPSQFEIAP